MDIFSDPVLLARLQFACTAAYHFIFVPLTIGLGLILAINETRYYRSRDPKYAAIPIILCTSKNQETDRVWGMRQGARDYIVKPVNAADLMSKISALN